MVKSDTASNSKPETSKIPMPCDEKMDAAKSTEADLLNPNGSQTTKGQKAMEWLLGKFFKRCRTFIPRKVKNYLEHIYSNLMKARSQKQIVVTIAKLNE